MEAIDKGALATHRADPGDKTLASKTNKSDETKNWLICGPLELLHSTEKPVDGLGCFGNRHIV